MVENRESAEGLYGTEAVRKMFNKELVTKEEELSHITKVMSESNLLAKDLTGDLNPKYAHNFSSVTSLPSYSEDKGAGAWLSPNIFRDILDKKEHGWKQVEEVVKPSRPSVIVREQDIPLHYPNNLDKDNMESNLIRLQTENLMLKQELVMMKQSNDPKISEQESEGKYEKLMQEVSKLKSVVDKVSNSRYFEEKIIVTFAYLSRWRTPRQCTKPPLCSWQPSWIGCQPSWLMKGAIAGYTSSRVAVLTAY